MIKYIFKYGLFTLLLSLVVVNITSCQEDENSGAAPEILGVSITDPAHTDSTFTQAHPGQMIVILGKNLQNTKKVFINDQEVYFNPNYNTATNIIVTIPSEESGFLLTAINPNLNAEIRVETARGVAAYHFNVLYNNPAISRIYAETYPCETGDELKVYGNNFVDIRRVYITDVAPDTQMQGQEIEVSGYSVDNNRYLDSKTNKYITESVMTFRLPELPYNNGYLIIECVSASASSRFSKLPPPRIATISSDMPISGSRLIITGSDFINVEKISINEDEIVILPEKLTVSATRDTISFIMPAKPASSGTLKVITFGGEAAVEKFYPYENLILNFDNLGYYSWGDGSIRYDGDPTKAPYVSDGVCYGIEGENPAWNWWWRQIVAGGCVFPSYDIIPAETPVSKLKLVYECYNEYPYNNGFILSRFPHWDSQNESASAKPLNMASGKYIFGNWNAVAVPLSSFAGIGATYGDIVNNGSTEMSWYILNYTGDAEPVLIYFDNVRLEVTD